MTDDPAGSGALSLSDFTAMDSSGEAAHYIEALEAFDRIPQLRELKRIEKKAVRAGAAVLDVGCGFGLETLRFAQSGHAVVRGIDRSEQFVEEARRRAGQAGIAIDYRTGDADALPYPEASFDHVRAERVLVYCPDVAAVLAGMRRVLRSDGTLALIEPDIGSATLNIADRDLVRRVMAYESDTAVAHSWLPGQLPSLLRSAGFAAPEISTRVLLFPQDLAAEYFLGAARKAGDAGVISAAELATWRKTLAALHASHELFASIGYFLFVCR